MNRYVRISEPAFRELARVHKHVRTIAMDGRALRVPPILGGGGGTGFWALLTGWRKFNADDADNPLYGYAWAEAYLDEDGVAAELDGGRNSGSTGGYVLNIESYGQGGTQTISHDYSPFDPDDGDPFDGTGDPTDLSLQVTLPVGWNPGGGDYSYVSVGTTPTGTDIQEIASETTDTLELTGLPADGTTFYIRISSAVGVETTDEIYECSITVTADTYAPAINVDDINRAAAFALRTPAGGGVEGVDDDTDAAPMDPVLVRMHTTTRTIVDGETTSTETQYWFEWPAVEYYGVIVDEADADVTTDYTDERYYVRRAKVSNATPDNAVDDVVVLTALTGDDAELVTVTNLAEAVDHTHNLAAGTPVIYYGVRGGDLPHRPRYVMQTGGAGAADAVTGYQRYVYDVDWDDETCVLTVTYHWFEFADGLLVDHHATDPT